MRRDPALTVPQTAYRPCGHADNEAVTCRRRGTDDGSHCRLLSAGSLVVGCAGLDRGAPPPAALSEQITVLGIPNARFWPDTDGTAMFREFRESLQRERAAEGNAATDRGLPPASFLAISGGGDNGAFGAGLLCGWADSGRLPQFKLV